MSLKIDRKVLIEDIIQLSKILETAHPDPYFYSGGKIAFHRILQKIIKEIPLDGMLLEDFYYHILPFVAQLKDGHTALFPDSNSQDRTNPGGIPLYFEPIDEKLFVSAVTTSDYLPLIGSLLLSVEGVPYVELINRMNNQRGFDNTYHLLGDLGMCGVLFFSRMLKRLIPEWKNEDRINVTLQHSNGTIKDYSLTPSQNVVYPLFKFESKELFPKSPEILSLFYHFLNQQKSIAFLRINNMYAYKEAYEYWHNLGLEQTLESAKRLFKKIHNIEPPETLPEIFAGIPSATTIFQSLFEDMKKSNTEYLIVDLRKCDGGYDAIITIFLYFLVGFEKAIESYMHRSEVQKLSKFFCEANGKEFSYEDISFQDPIPAIIKEYDFSADVAFQPNKESLKKTLIDTLSKDIEKMPSFHEFFKCNNYEAFYKPKKIIVLSSNITRSSAFDLMINLKRFGAITVGIPSSQSGNCFGNVRLFSLENSKIRGNVATKYFITFPDKAFEHLTHTPDFQLTYEKLSSYNFDENASILYALKLIEEKKI
ncbi:MAG: hypothetical protein JXA54_08080 [Candidatus Heimdallarchaeota archaeon]|nr:hypothetical protein [Candidatus Heimdallarchaeota archaeon]